MTGGDSQSSDCPREAGYRQEMVLCERRGHESGGHGGLCSKAVEKHTNINK